MIYHPVPQTAWTKHLPASVAPATVDVLAQESLPKAWLARWSADPTHVTVIDRTGRSVTADELEHRSRIVAQRLSRWGAEPGDRIVLSSAASLDLFVAYVAAHRLGLVVVPINTAYGADEIAHIVSNTRPRVALVDDPARGAVIAAASPEPILVTSCDVPLPDGAYVGLDGSDRSSPALICHTSGTTGVPKSAVLTSGNLLASAEAVRIAWRWTPEDRLALALPLFHLHGLGAGINGTLVAGASVVLLEQFKPDLVADAVDAHSATMFFGVPTMYHRFAESPRLDTLGRLRLCVSGSAPLSAALHRRIADGSGQRILERYGMTEAVMNVSNPYDGERRPGTVGLPLPGVEVRLADATDGASGASGEIQLRGPNVFPGYLHQPEATAASFTSDGWFRSGDLGELDDGYVRIVGRSKELIISGGYNVYPREVEEVLSAHPAIAEVAVVGRPSEEWGEIVVAVVVSAGEAADAEEVMKFAADRLAPYKRPRDVHFVSALPHNDLGKVVRNNLLIP